MGWGVPASLSGFVLVVLVVLIVLIVLSLLSVLPSSRPSSSLLHLLPSSDRLGD